MSAAAFLFTQLASPAVASGWRPAGSAAGASRGASPAATSHDAAVVQAAWQSQGPGGVRPQTGAAEFDPFDDPTHGEDAAAAPAEGDGLEFDPFEEPEEEIAAPAGQPGRVGAPAIEDTVEREPVEAPPADDEAVDDGLFEVQDAFDAPQRGSVGPSVEEAVDDDLNEAREAIEDEIERREREEDDAGQAAEDDSDPFQPGDASDRPRNDADDAAGAPNLEDEVEDDNMYDEDEFDDYDWRSQQAPGGYRFQPYEAQPELTPEQREERRRQLEQERLENAETCEEFVAGVKADNIRTVSLDIRLHGEAGEDFPFDCGFGAEMLPPRSWQQTTFLWKAAGLCHKPLYFEQVQMERYGHSWGPVLDPIVSGAHFFGTLPVLPYKMGITTPNECIYTLGYYRPGSCAPYMIPAVPFTWRAAAFEGAAWTTGALVIP